MLKLEDIYDVVVAKDGQEAFDQVKQSMDKGEFFDLIFMDVQVCYCSAQQLPSLMTACQDAKSRRSTKYEINSSDGVQRSNRCTHSIRRGKQCEGLL